MQAKELAPLPRQFILMRPEQYRSATGPGRFCYYSTKKFFHLNLITSGCTVYAKVFSSLCLHTSFVIFKLEWRSHKFRGLFPLLPISKTDMLMKHGTNHLRDSNACISIFVVFLLNQSIWSSARCQGKPAGSPNYLLLIRFWALFLCGFTYGDKLCTINFIRKEVPFSQDAELAAL